MNRFRGGIVCLLLFVLFEVTLQQSVGGLWRWRDTPNYRITTSGKDGLVVSVLDGKLGPYSGKITGNTLDVKFGPKCCTGKVSKDGKKIDWSNKTSWNRAVNATNTIRKSPAGKPSSTKAPAFNDLVRIADALAASRAKILTLTAEVQQHMDAAVAYSRKQNRPAEVISSLTTSHNQTQESLKAAHTAVQQLENNIRSAARPSTSRPTTPAPTTTPRPTVPQPTQPDKTANEPAGKLKTFVQKALETGKKEAAEDVRHIDALIRSISERRTKSLKKRLEEKDKRQAKKRQERDARRAKRREARRERRQKKEDARHQRMVAYEHFRKRNPSQAELDKLQKLRDEERALRRTKAKEESRKRREEEHKKRRERRKEEKGKRAERKQKREKEWKEGMDSITREVETVARKTVITIGHTIQGMEEALTQASNQLDVLNDACRQGQDLKSRFDHSRKMTLKMKSLAVQTINSLKTARKFIDIEAKRHEDRVTEREREAERTETEERIESRNKRRERRRRYEDERKRERINREKGRKERHSKRSEELRKRDRNIKLEADEKKARDEQEKKDRAEREKKRIERRKKEEKKEEKIAQTTDLAEEIRKTLQSVVNVTETSIKETIVQTLPPPPPRKTRAPRTNPSQTTRSPLAGTSK